MLYREMGKTGDKVSILGYGCMRFPRKDRKIDEERAEKQVLTAIDKGVNYIDTAYIYPGSEVTLGKILSKDGYRNRVMIASKMPPIMIHSQKDMESVLNTQLSRLQTDHIDYYLMHALNGLNGWRRMKENGIEEFIEKARKSGKIGRFGFSYHGDRNQFKDIVDDYRWDFCQIQYNYMDENNQAGRDGLQYAASKGLGISVMEPLRGGLLARKMPPEVQAVFDQAEVRRSPAEWALRWIWDQPEVSVVLSGMNEEAQIEENIRIAGDAAPHSLRAADQQRIAGVRELLAKKLKVGCTGCGYCMPCPAGVNIPMCFSYYNDKYVYEKPIYDYSAMLAGFDGSKPSYASLCVNCGKCESHCPQHLPIRQHLREVAGEMESFYFKPTVALVQRYYKLRRWFGRKNRSTVGSGQKE